MPGIFSAGQIKGWKEVTGGGIIRISPQEFLSKGKSGSALLVCIYDDEICKSMHLDGAVSFNEFANLKKVI